jgi:hypothetical protein
MDSWKQSFLDKLGQAQSKWVGQFDEVVKKAIEPAFDELSEFLRSNGFKVSTPLGEQGRRSYKFELAENAYLLMIFRFASLGECELRCESFVPGGEPKFTKLMVRVADVSPDWGLKQFRDSLDEFIDVLNGSSKVPRPSAADKEPALV